jgi:hypothetical protein
MAWAAWARILGAVLLALVYAGASLGVAVAIGRWRLRQRAEKARRAVPGGVGSPEER